MKVIKVLYYFCEPWREPLTPDEFTTRFGHSDDLSPDEKDILIKYIVVCKDGLIRVRNLSGILDWRKRYRAQITQNWNALGVSNQ